MDESEKLAMAALAHLGHREIVYEPDGNVPPDFLIGGRVAIEVRRLNQNDNNGINAKGLEEVAIPLSSRIENLLLSMGTPTRGESWVVYYSFVRPMESWGTLKLKLRSIFEGFIASETQVNSFFDLGRGFRLEISRAAVVQPTFFVMGGYNDDDEDGWVRDKLRRNLEHCIQEKSKKIAPYRSKYPEWWLILPDHIGYASYDFRLEHLRAQISTSSAWDRVILVNPLDHTRIFEI